MEALHAGILSVLIALSGWLHDGLKAFDAKKYDDAITQLTKVIEKDIPQNKYRDIALFYRAKSYKEKGNKDKALADMLTLIHKCKNSSFITESRKLYKDWGGDVSKLLPEDSPKKVWEKFVAAARAGDVKTALNLSTGDWKTMVLKETRNNPEKLKREFARQEFEVGNEKIESGKNAGKATLPLTVDGNEVVFLEFSLDKEQNIWQISGHSQMPEKRTRHRRSTVIENINKLKQIGLACRMYSNVFNENFPPNLNALKTEGFLENEDIYLWTNSKTGKQLPFIYCPGHTEADSVDTMIAAAPTAVNKQRDVLWLDGHVKTISENEFIRNAKQQKWILPEIIKKKDIPEEKRKKAKELIAKLADNDFDVREKAKKELIKMGVEAYPFLEENKNHPDPEVKMTIREILKGK